jgi:hypothetical protein
MNPLDTLIDKLKVKPQVHEQQSVIVKLRGVPETISKNPVTIQTKITDRRAEGYNPDRFLERIQQNKLTKVVQKKYEQPEKPVVIESKAPIMESEKEKEGEEEGFSQPG